MRQPIRVLIAEDMQTTYYMLRRIIEENGNFEVVGWAMDGKDVVHQAKNLQPDIVTMDIQMPQQCGLQAIEEIMSSDPVPIVVISSLANDHSLNIAFEALEKGALDVLGKPVAITDPDFGPYCDSLRAKLAALSEVKVIRRRPKSALQGQSAVPQQQSSPARAINGASELVAIGASAGGPEALHKILAELPEGYARPIVVAQHIVEGFIGGMVDWLDQQCPVRVKLAEHNEPLSPGTVYFAPDKFHLLVQRQGDRLAAVLDDSPPLGGFRPSINVLLQSVAGSCGKRAIGGILTGMGSDGAVGLRAIADKGGSTFAQDEASSLIFSMPKTALEMGAARHTLPLKEIPGFIG